MSHIECEAVLIAHFRGPHGPHTTSKSVTYHGPQLEGEGALDVPSLPMIGTVSFALGALICKKTVTALARRGS